MSRDLVHFIELLPLYEVAKATLALNRRSETRLCPERTSWWGGVLDEEVPYSDLEQVALGPSYDTFECVGPDCMMKCSVLIVWP